MFSRHSIPCPPPPPARSKTSPRSIRKFTLWFACSSCALLLTPWQLQAQQQTLRDPQLRRLYLSVRTPICADSVWIIADTLQLPFPDFHLTLRRGTLLALRDSVANATGLLYEGEAQVDFHPRSPLERFQLKRFTRDSVLSCTTSRLLLRAVKVAELPAQNPAAAQRLTAVLRNSPQGKNKSRREAEELQKVLGEGLGKRNNFNLAARLLAYRLVDATEFVLCAFYPEHSRQFSPPLHIYVYDAYAQEQVAFYSYFPKRIGRQFFTLCSYALTAGATASPAAWQLTRYNGWVALQENGRIQADMGIDLHTGKARPAALSFSLSPDLAVSKITAESGDTLDFVQEPEEAGVTAFPAPAAWQSDTLRLLFHYEGAALRRHDNNTFFLKDAINWVPRLGYLQRAHYQIIFKCPLRQRVQAVGELVRDWDEAGSHLSFFKTVAPAKAATFCMGNFQNDTLVAARPGLPAIIMHTSWRRSHEERRRVAGDLANSLYFYGKFLGAYEQPSLRVVEAPTVHSQGFPGFLTLSWLGFEGHLDGVREALRGHEIAHQWFGNLTGWRTYHDQWLSESFAEYLGAMYVEWLARTPGQFEQILRSWRDDALEHGHIGANLGMQQFGLGKAALRNAEGDKAGPIWMGARLGQHEVLDYYTQTYEKGAYVVHMLRGLLRDLQTGSDDRFWNMLADFIASQSSAEPGTTDLQRIAEKHYGAPLDWFFQQWIYQNQVPSYRWQYALMSMPVAEPVLESGMPVASTPMEAPGHAKVVRVYVQQEDVPPEFGMFVPIRVECGDSTKTTVRAWITGQATEVDIPLHGQTLDRISFNAGEAVLCRIKGENGERLRTSKEMPQP